VDCCAMSGRQRCRGQIARREQREGNRVYKNFFDKHFYPQK